jgi:hypothetical protein
MQPVAANSDSAVARSVEAGVMVKTGGEAALRSPAPCIVFEGVEGRYYARAPRS